MTSAVIWREDTSGVSVEKMDGKIYIRTSERTPPVFRKAPYVTPLPYDTVDDAVANARELVAHIMLIVGVAPDKARALGNFM